MKKIFAAIFSAGIVSLFMELSLVREFVYVIGSSAFSNSLIISVFLAGLAGGSYLGIWKQFKPKNEREARKKFVTLQFILVAFIFVFYVTKDYFIYISMNQAVVLGYFIIATFIPAAIAGASYAMMVELLYHKGERYILYIYAVSTFGNVFGGLLYGYVFVYLVGIQASYVWSIICLGIAAFLIFPFQRKREILWLTLSIVVPALLIHGNYINTSLYRFKNLLYQKYSPFGLVEVWKTDDAGHVEMTIGNVHQYYSYDWDNDVHRQWADTALEITHRPSDVLILGYGSGISTAQFLKSPLAQRVDTIENCAPVMDASKQFFPEEYQSATTDPRSHILVEDFKNYVRFTDRTYDIILLDHSITDPYYSGFFTVEFYDQIKRIMKPHAVVASLGTGLSYDTTRSSFPYMYRFVGVGRELISTGGFFLSIDPFDETVQKNFAAENPAGGTEPLYSDRRIIRNSIKTALSAIKPRVTHPSVQ